MENRNIYKGHRYVPKIMGEWNDQEQYEGLSIVTNQGTSYTSKKSVPVGVDILNTEYWVVTGNYNAQVEHYRQDVRDMQDLVNSKANQNYVEDEINSVNHQLEQTTDDLLQRGINIKLPPYNAHADGVSHKLSERFSTLEEAQTIFTAATSLNDEIDWAAMQTVLDSTNVLSLVAGRYVVNKTLEYYTRHQITGMGDNSVIVSNVIGSPVLKNHNRTVQTHLRNFKIEGNGQETAGIEIISPYVHSYINHISIVGVGGSAIYLEKAHGVYSDGLHIIGNGITEHGIYIKEGNANRFTGMEIKLCDIGVWSTFTHGLSIIDCLFEDNYGTAIYMEGAVTPTVRDVYFESNGNYVEEIDGVQKDLGDSYDIHINNDELRANRNIRIADCYFRSNYVKSTIKINALVLGGKLDNLFVRGFVGNVRLTDVYDINLHEGSALKTENIESYRINDHGKSNLIHVTNDIEPVKFDREIQLQYMDGTSGVSVDGNIDCDIDMHYVQYGGLTQVNFKISNMSLADIPNSRIVTLSLPIKRNGSGNGFFTAPIHYTGSDEEVLGLYMVLEGRTNENARIYKVGTSTDPSTRFDTSNLKNLTSLVGSLVYY